MALLVLFFLTNMIAVLLGYILGRGKAYDMDVVQSALKSVKNVVNKSKAGVIDYPTPEEMLYNGSEREKIDKQQEKLMREAGIIP